MAVAGHTQLKTTNVYLRVVGSDTPEDRFERRLAINEMIDRMLSSCGQKTALSGKSIGMTKADTEMQFEKCISELKKFREKLKALGVTYRGDGTPLVNERVVTLGLPKEDDPLENVANEISFRAEIAVEREAERQVPDLSVRSNLRGTSSEWSYSLSTAGTWNAIDIKIGEHGNVVYGSPHSKPLCDLDLECRKRAKLISLEFLKQVKDKLKTGQCAQVTGAIVNPGGSIVYTFEGTPGDCKD
ncbi:MAG: hypothetical protein HY074_06920 [Deltaproteobacteria bacterium]|nr:hypothetical protein [Deltaproteobacteria bacterium]